MPQSSVIQSVRFRVFYLDCPSAVAPSHSSAEPGPATVRTHYTLLQAVAISRMCVRR